MRPRPRAGVSEMYDNVPAALQHTWSGHAKSQMSEVYKKL